MNRKKILTIGFTTIILLSLMITTVFASSLDVLTLGTFEPQSFSELNGDQLFWKNVFQKYLDSKFKLEESTELTDNSEDSSIDSIENSDIDLTLGWEDSQDGTFTLENDLDVLISDTTKANYTQYTQLVETPPSDDNELLQDENLNSISLSAIAPILEEDTTPNDEPVYGDNTTIEFVTIRWLSTDDQADTDSGTDSDPAMLERKPSIDTDDVRNQQFQIDFALSGEGNFAPGTVELTFPAVIWTDRDGGNPGELTLAIPEAPDEGAEFVWTRKGDTIVVTNNRPISAASRVTIQGTFRNIKAHEIVNDSYSRELQATVTVTTPADNLLTYRSNKIQAHLLTDAEVSYAGKTAWNDKTKKYDIWWDEAPAELPQQLRPENEQDYAYIRWYVTGSGRGNQPFTLTITDTETAGYFKDSPDNKCKGIILGATGAMETDTQPGGVVQAVTTGEGTSVSAVVFQGYDTTVKGCYIWAAYPKDFFQDEDGEYIDKVAQFSNEQTTRVTTTDSNHTTEKTAQNVFDTKPPIEWTFIKTWNDEDNAAGHRPDRLYITINKKDSTDKDKTFQKKTLTKADAIPGTNENQWIYKWRNDSSYLGDFSVTESHNNLRGVLDTFYDENGKAYQTGWEYWEEHHVTDPAAHLIEITNTYREDGEYPAPNQDITKSVESKYGPPIAGIYPNVALLELLRNQSVDIGYDIKSFIETGIKGEGHLKEFVLEDVRYILDDNSDFTLDDVAITSVELRNPTAYKYVEIPVPDDEHRDFKFTRERIATPDSKLQGFINGEWVDLATMHNGAVTAIEENGATAVEKRVYLPRNVSKVRQVLQSVEAIYVVMDYRVYLTVYPTKPVQDMIEAILNDEANQSEFFEKDLLNYAQATATDIESDILIHDTGETGARGRLYGRQYKVAAELEKEFTLSYNDVKNKRAVLHSKITLTQQSNITNKEEYYTVLENNEIPNTRYGTYYDLLPAGIEPDTDTIRVTIGETGDDEVANISVIPNYKNSGRTLLIVKVNLTDQISYTKEQKYNQEDYPDSYQNLKTYPEKGYKNTHTLDFDAYISWDTLEKDPNFYKNNLAAYESDEPAVGSLNDWKGEPDDPTAGNNILSANAVGDEADLMKGLDNNRSDNSFVYASDPVTFDEIDTSATADIQKHVQAAGDSTWSEGYLKNDVNVEEGGAYRYRIFMRAFKDTSIEDIIILDSLENYQPRDIDHSDDINDVKWHGTLTSVDVSPLVEKGIAPVVYYSVVPNIDLSKYNTRQEPGAVLAKLSDESVWTTVAPEDMSQVKAIAIDASRKEDGTKFVLGEENHIEYYLNMIAPAEIDNPSPDYFKGTDGSDHLKNGHAYNNIYLDCLSQNGAGVPTQSYINYSYTKVGIYTKSMDVYKVWDDDNNRDGIRPDSVKVKLLENGQVVQEKELSASNNWKTTFERLHTYDKNGNPIQYTIEEESDSSDSYSYTVSTKVNDDGSISAVVKNFHDPEKISIPVTKFWDDNDDSEERRPYSVTVKLFANGEDTGRTLTLTRDNDWIGEFTDLLKYEDGQEIEYTIGEVLVDDYRLESTEKTENGIEITNKYDPRGNLIVEKHVEGPEYITDKSFTFNLQLYTLSQGTEDQETEIRTPVNGEFEYTIFNQDGSSTGISGNIRSGESFNLKDGQYIEIKDLPTHIYYEVTEKETKGFTSGSIDSNGEILSYVDKKAEFTNTYSSTGSINLAAKKELDGIDLKAYQFEFELKDETGRVLQTTRNDASGNITFGRINYTNEDVGTTFIYKISEKVEEKGGYTYDQTIYTVEVTLQDNGDGTITVNAVYKDNDGNEIEPVFENSYEAKGSVSLRAWKSLPTRLPEDEEFEFELFEYIPEDNEADQTESLNSLGKVHNDGNGVINFNEIEYTQADVGTHLYFAREIIKDKAHIIYDDHIIAYEVTVSDNGDGTLNIGQKSFDGAAILEECSVCEGTGKSSGIKCGSCIDGSGYVLMDNYTIPSESTVPQFNNQVDPGDLTITKKIAKDSENDGSDQIFRFKLRLMGEDVPDELEYTKTPPDSDTQEVLTLLSDDPEEIEVDAQENEDQIDEVSSVSEETENIEEDVQVSDEETDEIQTFSEEAEESLLDIQDHDENTELSTEENLLPLSDSGQNEISPIADDRPIKVSNNYSEITWTIYEDGELVFSPKEGTSGKVASWGTASNVYPPWYGYRSSITKVSATDKIWFETTSNLFYGLSSVTEIDLTNFDTSQLGVGSVGSKIYSMSNMFKSCNKLTKITGIESLDTHLVENMQSMFSDCNNLTDLDLSQWNTENLKNTSYMFYNCSKLENLNLTGLDTTKVTTMSCMFYGCKALRDLDLDSLDTGAVQNMASMFYNCETLDELDLSGFDTSSVTNMNKMFEGCKALTSLNLESFDTSQVTNMASMFSDCRALDNINLESFNTSKVLNMSLMFSDCRALVDLDLSMFDTSLVSDMNHMFYYCNHLKSVDVSSFNTQRIADFSSMFAFCSALENLDVANFENPKTKMKGMFQECYALKSLNIGNISTEGLYTNADGSYIIFETFGDNFDLAYINFGPDFFKCSGDSLYGTNNLFTGYNLTTSKRKADKQTFLKKDWIDTDQQEYLYKEDFKSHWNGLIQDENKEHAGWWIAKDYQDTITNAYWIKFVDPSQGSTGNMPERIAFSDEDYSIPQNKFKRPGYHMIGWENVETGQIYLINNRHAYITAGTYETGSQITLKPIWMEGDESKVSLIFDGEGQASIDRLYKSVTAGENFKLETFGFTRPNYSLTGWEWRDNSGKIYNLGQEISGSDLNEGDVIFLYPVWKEGAVNIYDNEFSFTLKKDQSITFTNIPAGTTYQVWEETPAGWILVDCTGEIGVIDPETSENPEAVFTNTYSKDMTKASIVATKLYDGIPNNLDRNNDQFTFTLYEIDEEGTEKPVLSHINIPVKENGIIQLDIEYKEEDVGVHNYVLREDVDNSPDAIVDYDEHGLYVSVEVNQDNEGLLSTKVTYLEGSKVFENESILGNLLITKAFDDPDNLENLTEETRNTEFTFEVLLTDESGYPVADGKTYKWSIVGATEQESFIATTTGGLIKVKAKIGQTIEITGLEPGINYEVRESDIPANWSVSNTLETTGTIEAVQSSSATITNRYLAQGIASFQFFKSFDKELKADQFSFELYDEEGHKLAETTNMDQDTNESIQDGDELVLNPGYGKGAINFNVSYKTPENKPGDSYLYRIHEVRNNADGSVIYDDHDEWVRVTLSDGGNGILKTEVEYLGESKESDGSGSERIFTNTSVTGDLTVSKELINSGNMPLDYNDDFEFEISLKDSENNPLTGTYSYTTTAPSEGTISDGGTISIKAGQSFTIKDLPYGCHYQITEKNKKNFKLVSSIGNEGDILSSETKTAEFKNEYVDPGKVIFTAQKLLNGQGTIPVETYAFDLLQDGRVIQTKYANENGVVLFDEISFTDKDSGKNFIYSIREVTPNNKDEVLRDITPAITFDPTIGYDSHIEQFHVNVNYDPTSGLTVTKRALTNQDRQSDYDAVFENISLTGDLKVTKSVIAKNIDKNKEFSFTVTLYRGSEVAEDISGEYGDMTFNEGIASFTLKDLEEKTAQGLPVGLQYKVEETLAEGYTNVFTVREGVIEANETITEAFENVQATQGFSVSKQVTGIAGETDKAFGFKVTLYRDGQVATDIDQKFGQIEFTQGVATFALKHHETVVAFDLPIGLSYTIEELDYSDDGYETTVNGEPGNSYSDEIDDDLNSVEFINNRDEIPPKYGSLTVAKRVEAVEPNIVDGNEVFHFLIQLSDHSINGRYGDITFTLGSASIDLKSGESKTASNLPAGITYTVSEESNGAYTESSTGTTGSIVQNTEARAEFVNTLNTGNLSVTKYVEDLNIDPNLEFKFTITLTDKTINGTYGDMFFINGESTVWIKHGQTLTATGLPIGIGYEVTEVKNPHYTISSEGTEGEIIKDETQSAVFTNTRDKGSLSVTKIIDDENPDVEAEFTFTITLSDTTINGTFGDMTFTEGKTTVVLKHGQTLTATDLPVGITYEVAELPDENYTAESEGASGTIVKDTVQNAKFTNTKDTGSLSVRKLIDDENPDLEAEFTFIVTLSDNTINGTFGDMTFSGGEATVVLKHGQTLTATGLPKGITYEVVELSDENYTAESEGESGTITKDEVQNAVYTNKPTEDESEVGSLSVTKTVVGSGDDLTREFQFTVTLSDNTINGQYGQMIFTNGVATFTLRHNQTRTATNLPVGISYQVAESGAAGFTASSNNTSGTIEKDKVQNASFINTKNTEISRTGSLSVTKNVVGSPEDQNKNFTFVVTLSDNTINGQYGQMNFKNGVATFTLKHNETKKADNLPEGITYTVTETDNDGYQVNSVGETGTIAFNETGSVKFTNLKTNEKTQKTVDSINGETVKDTDMSTDVDGSTVSPIISIGDIITYKISWHNDTGKTADVTVTDLLDEGVDFVSASNNGTYDSKAHRVTWTIKNQSAGASGELSLEVRVNDKADGIWNYDKHDPDKADTSNPNGDSTADHQIVNKAVVNIGNSTTVTNTVRSPIEGLYIEKIHAIVSIPELDGYRDGIFESGGVYDLPLNAYNPNDGIGFTNKLDQDTHVNDYKKTFIHDPGNTVRYYVKVTNNYKEDLDHVIIMDPVRANSLQSTNSSRTVFNGIAGVINNVPEVEGRTQQYVNVEPVRVENGVVTFKLTSTWNETWGDANVEIEDVIPDNATFVGAYYRNYEGSDSYLKLTADDSIKQGGPVTVTGKDEYADTSISLENNTVTWRYSINDTDPETDNILYLQLRIPGATKNNLSNISSGTYGGIIKNVIDVDSSVGRTNDIKAIFNQDDIDGDDDIETNEGYLRWELDKLPGTDSAKKLGLSADGYPANVQIVYFCWDMPDGVDEFTSWKNTAYVQTMENLEQNLSELYPEDYKNYQSRLNAENDALKQASVEDDSETLEALEVETDQEKLTLDAMGIDLSGDILPGGTLEQFATNRASTDLSSDNSNKDHVSIYSDFGWQKLSNAMMASNTVMEVINAGNLEITKQVSGETDPNKEYSFKINLNFKNALSTNNEASELVGNYQIMDKNGNLTGYEVNNGNGRFTLKAGESVRIENLPLRTEFTITELNTAGYDVDSTVINPDGTKNESGAVATGSITVNNSWTQVQYVNTVTNKNIPGPGGDTPDNPNQNDNPGTPDNSSSTNGTDTNNPGNARVTVVSLPPKTGVESMLGLLPLIGLASGGWILQEQRLNSKRKDRRAKKK